MDAVSDQALRKKYSTALMSNHKWRKFFLVMSEYASDFSGIEYRFTDSANIFYGNAPSPKQVWDKAIDDPVSGFGGPVEYKHIESLFIPRVYHYRRYINAPISNRVLDLDRFLSELEKLGQFPIKKTSHGIHVYGYQI
jgi:hypothetical protein